MADKVISQIQVPQGTYQIEDPDAVHKTGDSMSSYKTDVNGQIRNIFVIADGASMPTGINGDICLVY